MPPTGRGEQERWHSPFARSLDTRPPRPIAPRRRTSRRSRRCSAPCWSTTKPSTGSPISSSRSISSSRCTRRSSRSPASSSAPTRWRRPVTIKTFLPTDLAIGDINLATYIARLAAEATTIINAEDYGRAVYDLALRRSLIGIGEDMVNVAYDATVEQTPGAQIEEAEKQLFDLAEKGQYGAGFQSFDRR